MAKAPIPAPGSPEYVRRRDRALAELRELASPGLGAALDAELQADARKLAARWQARHDELAAELARVDTALTYWKGLAGG